MNGGAGRENAVSDALGAIFLVAVVGMAVTLLGVAFLSQPPPQKIPAVSVDVTTICDTLYIHHDGGDTLYKGEYLIRINGNNMTPTGDWSVGDTLEYPIPSGQYPASIQVISLIGGYSQVISQVQAQPTCWSDNFDDNHLSNAWTMVNGTWSESGQVLSQTSTAAGDPKKAIISNTGQLLCPNQSITAKMRIDSWADGQDMSRGGVSLFSNTIDGNGYNLLFHTDHNTLQFLDDKIAWGPVNAYTWTSGTWYWFKLKVDNGILYGKVWQDGSAEPAAWAYSQTWSGRTGYPALNGGSADAGGHSTVSFDDVTVCPL